MIHPPASVRVYLATTPFAMRGSFDGLHALVNAVLQLDAFAGHLFVFGNRRRDRVKICTGIAMHKARERRRESEHPPTFY
jgi:transposase